MTIEMRERALKVNGIRLHVTEAGAGPLVLLCHGWPELGYSWRHQLRALAEAGYHAVAPDMRGYGRSDAPDDVSAYSLFHLVGDVVALVTELGEREAIVVGHDWGATVAWHTALLRPDVFRAVAAMSVPYRGRAPADPLALLRQNGHERFYLSYFQTPHVPDAELERDVELTFRKLFYGRATGEPLFLPEGGGFLDGMRLPDACPSWLTEADLAVFVREFTRTGFRGGLGWYRNLSPNWALTEPWQGAKITQPALFIAGTHDGVVAGARGAAGLKNMASAVPNLTTCMLDGAGHWVQQERPDEVNAALVAFLDRACGRQQTAS